MKNFSSFLTEAEDQPAQPTPEKAPQSKRVNDSVVATFGRFNPPHAGHQRALDYAHKLAGEQGADEKFYASKSHDPKKNPLEYDYKVNTLKKMFPDHADKWDTDEEVSTILHAAKKASDAGYKKFHFVGGEDRRQAMEDLLRKYNGQEGHYAFDEIHSHSAGAREDADGSDPVANYSASGQRKYALDNDFEGFKGALPIGDNYNEEDARELFHHLRALMTQAKTESWEADYRSHAELIREAYRDGDWIEEGDLVEHLGTGLVGSVHRTGCNHLICVTENGIMFKAFPHDVSVL